MSQPEHKQIHVELPIDPEEPPVDAEGLVEFAQDLFPGDFFDRTRAFQNERDELLRRLRTVDHTLRQLPPDELTKLMEKHGLAGVLARRRKEK